MTNIRVTYSGLISFFVGSSTIFTGLIFTLIITRTLNQEEFGTWAIIGTLIGYVLILNPIISYWNTREIARGEKTGRTAINTSGVFAALAFFIYLIIAFFYSKEIGIDTNILFFGAILIPLEFFRSILVGITNGYKPQLEEYGKITFEISKIGLALMFLYFLDMGLFGLIISVFFATAINVVFLGISSRSALRGKFNKQLILKWIKLFWIPIFPNIPIVILSTEIIIFSVFTGGVTGIAYWTAAFTVSRIVRNSRLIAKAIYPKTLQGGSKKIFETNFSQVLYFAFPLSAISLVFSKAGLFALNPVYIIAYPVVLWIVPTIFLRNISEVFGNVLKGYERVDVNKNANFKDYIKSKLVFLPILKIIHRSSYLGILTLILFLLSTQEIEQIELVTIWAIISFLTQIPLTTYVFILLKKEINPKFEVIPIIKYLISSILIFSIMYFVLENFLIYNERIFIFLPNLIGYLALGISGYFGMTYCIDKKTRITINSIIKEIRSRK